MSFLDGTEVHTLDLPDDVDVESAGVHHAPDGSIWIAPGGLYVITPEAMAAAE